MPRELQFQNTVKNLSIGDLKHSIETTKKNRHTKCPKTFHEQYSVRGEKNPFNIATEGGQKPNTTVLVSAGIELIFFLVAGSALCFGFSVRIMLITH